uniref:Uncharacterized protein n=1 Tax=Pararge aegeria TaxID=116150 RepID=S4NW39_9NEOP
MSSIVVNWPLCGCYFSILFIRGTIFCYTYKYIVTAVASIFDTILPALSRVLSVGATLSIGTVTKSLSNI